MDKILDRSTFLDEVGKYMLSVHSRISRNGVITLNEIETENDK